MGLTRKSLSLFTRGRDIISTGPVLDGVHEPALTSLIRKYAQDGYSDFLIDIGANIGLTSCQNGDSFREVHMYEPNWMCCNILEVKSKIAITSSEFEIHKYGLGKENKTCTLTIPRHNWGGGFIKDAGNSYSDKVLAAKDNFTSLEAIS